MGNLFSSSGKQAQQAAGAEGNIAQQSINQIEQYTNQQEQALRGAISGVGPNPYFAAAQAMSPQGYAVNPSDTVTFGASGPGTTQGKLSMAAAPQAVNPPPPPSAQSGVAPMPAPNPNPPPRVEPPGPRKGGPIPLNAFSARSPMVMPQ